jgi:hypothetical protein
MPFVIPKSVDIYLETANHSPVTKAACGLIYNGGYNMLELGENNINNGFFFKIYKSGGNFLKNSLHML